KCARMGRFLLELLHPNPVVDRPAVVRVYQAQVPSLATLIDIGYSRRRELQKRLCQAIDGTGPADRRAVSDQIPPEHRMLRRAQDSPHELLDRILVAGIR